MKCPKCGSEEIDTILYENNSGVQNKYLYCSACSLEEKIQVDDGILTHRQRDLALLGQCPWCEENIRDFWRFWGKEISEYTPTGQRMKEEGVDSRSGHKLDCEHKDIKL